MSYKPTHPMSKEDERIDAVCRALAVSTSCDPRRDEEEEKREAVIDLLTNLQHYARKHNWDFEDLLQTAQGHFTEECKEG